MCQTLWCFTRWTVSPLSHTLKIRNFFLPAHKQAPARAWQKVSVIYQQETLSSQNSCLTQSPKCGSLVFWKRWCLPWKGRHAIMGVLAGSCSGWMTDLPGWKMDLHDLLNIINSENSIWNAQVDTLPSSYFSVSGKHDTQGSSVSTDQIEVFHPAILSFLPFSFWGYIFPLSCWFILLHGVQCCFAELFLCM